MRENQSGYRFFEQFMTMALFADLAIFLLYLITAGVGASILKIIFAVVAFVLSGVSLFLLYYSKELVKPRSLWLTAAFGSVVVCTLVSLICNYPAP